MANRNRSNPFDNDPFSSGRRNGGNDPFSSGGSSSGSDPFASGNRSRSGGNDPFSPGGGSSSGSDPFASGSRSRSGGNDPFAPGGQNNNYDPFSPPAQGRKMPPANDPFAGVPAQPEEEQYWPRQDNSDRRNRLQGIRTNTSSAMSGDPNEDIWVIRSIEEKDLTNYGFFQKLMEGIPIFCNYMYVMTLVRADNSAHSMMGSARNAVIYGKMTHTVLQVQDRIMVSGKEKRTGYIVDRVTSVDSNMEIPISKFWQDPDKINQPGNKKGNGGLIPILVGATVILMLLIHFLSGAVGSADLSKIFTIILVVAAVLLYLKVTNFAALRSPLFTKFMIGLILCFVVLYVPGGEQVGVLLLTCLGLWILLKSFLR